MTLRRAHPSSGMPTRKEGGAESAKEGTIEPRGAVFAGAGSRENGRRQTLY